MSTFYLQILADQNPEHIGDDEAGRKKFAVNFSAMARGKVADFPLEVANALAAAGLGTVGSTIFIGRSAKIPEAVDNTDTAYITVIGTAGSYPIVTHDGSIYDRLSVQVITRALSYVTANSLANDVVSALDQTRNKVLYVE